MANGGFRDDDLFEINMALRCEVKALEHTVQEFKNGARYKKLQEDYHRVCVGYQKEIQKLKIELGKANATIISVRNIWFDQLEEVYKKDQKELLEKNETIRQLEDKIWELERRHIDEISKLKMEQEDKLYEKDCIIDELKQKLAHAEALLGQDSTNTGLPTSQTPPGKKKHIPNTREKTGRKKGGQPGHEMHSLEPPEESEVTDTVEHRLSRDDCVCPSCDDTTCIPTGNTEIKYEYEVEVKVKKIKHIFYEYLCLHCGTYFQKKEPPNLRGNVQYGSTVQAMILSMTNNVNAAMNKTAMFIKGITLGKLTPSEGYIAKLQKRASEWLIPFREDLKRELIQRCIVYWDDTVIMIMTKRGCLRFYGDETLSYYTAHMKKDMEGIDEDQVLALLTPDTFSMHDHCSISYNEKFCFLNIECLQHLERDLQKTTDATGHEWSGELKKLISRAIHDRKRLIEKGEQSFSKEYLRDFLADIKKCKEKGRKENDKNTKHYGASEERALLRRLDEYHINYFLWLEEFSLPTTNNVSERALRTVKSHLRVSGQFESEEYAKYYADIKTYTETCRKNGINEMEALIRLCEGNPYTVREIFHSKDEKTGNKD